MNFLFVDRIYDFQPSQSAKGIKHVTASDTYLKEDSKGRAILPACIIGEALGQLTAWIVMEACDFLKRPVAGIAEEVKIYRNVYVGESILLHTEIERLDDQVVLYSSYATVCDETVFSLKHSMGPLLPMKEFIDPSRAKEQFNMIYRIGLPPIKKKEVSASYDQIKIHNSVPFFDQILEFNDTSIQAFKNVSLLEPFFDDHFPRKPVLPLTLLLEGKLELAYSFLEKILGEEEAQYFLPVHLQKIRIKQFIFPGDSFITTLSLKERKNKMFHFNFKTQIGQKTVCTVDAIFKSNSCNHL